MGMSSISHSSRGRASLNLRPHIALEAEGAYDFGVTQNRTLNFSTGITDSARSNTRVYHAMFGPKLQIGGAHALRAFATVKGGLDRVVESYGAATVGNALN